MTGEHLEDIDLNLLRHLDALLREAHVTRAARRVGLTQSAMSRSLAKLRLHLADPLLVRTARGLRATPRARALAAPLRLALGALEAAVRDRPTFDPATSTRQFTVASSDYADALLLPPLLGRLAREAPGVDVAVLPGARDGAALLEEDGDVAVSPRRGGTAAIVWRRLFREDFVCVLRDKHPALSRRLTLDRFLALPQVLVAPGGQPGSLLDDALARLGKRRRVAVRVNGFLVAPFVVAASNLIATLPRRLAERSASILPLRLVPPPLALDGFDIHLAWHERHRQDPGHRWFRDLVAESLR